jgi:regulatory protein
MAMKDNNNKNSSNLSSPAARLAAALQKLRHYCTYQERSHFEVKQKLRELGVRYGDQDEIVATLIDEDYLNEERFAIQFAGGKFRMKEWGKKKILYGLKEKRVSEYCIKKALSSIDQEDYLKTLNKLAEEKYESLKSESLPEKKKKTIDYLIQKGYEYDLVNKAVSYLADK